MLQLLIMEDPVQRVFSPEFLKRCRIDADIGLIPAKSGPDFPSTLAERDSRHSIFARQEMGPAQRAVDDANRQGNSITRMEAFPERVFLRRHVLQEDGDQVVPVSCRIRRGSFAGFALTRQGCIECRSSSLIKVHGMDGYAPAIPRHIHSHLPPAVLLTSNFLKFCQDVNTGQKEYLRKDAALPGNNSALIIPALDGRGPGGG
jgi:hypothetical protein